jgi:hypothetical protein
MHRLQELVRLHRLGTPCREVARLLRMGPAAERAYRKSLATAGLLAGPPDAVPEVGALRAVVEAAMPPLQGRQEVSSAEPWAAQITALAAKGAGAKAIYDHLVLEVPGFSASFDAAKRLARRTAAAAPVRPEDVAIPVTTPPGEVAQVDFAEIGRLLDPVQHVLRRAWIFLMVLAHSRHQFVRIVFDQRVATWVSLHVEAFEYFGGVPRVIVPDNLKAAVIRGAFSPSDDVALNRSYRELARQHLMAREFPAPQTGRDFLDRFHEEDLPLLQHWEKSSVTAESSALQVFGGANKALATYMQRYRPRKAATVDVDATILESDKRAAMAPTTDDEATSPCWPCGQSRIWSC